MALDIFRSASKSFLGLALIGLIVMSFAVFGIGDIFRSNANRAVAVVGSEEISIIDYNAEYQRRLNVESRTTGTRISPNSARERGLDRQILNEMITRSVMDQSARELGVVTSDNHVADVIKADETFNGVGGQFDELVYENLLRQNGLVRATFEERIREDITTDQIIAALTVDSPVPNGMAEALLDYRAERRITDYLMLTPDLVADVGAPDEETIATFYDQNTFSYTSPEYREISYIALAPGVFFEQASINVTDLEALYERRKSEFITAEERSIELISLPSEEQARIAYDRIKGGDTFDFVATTMGLATMTTNLGFIEQIEISDPAVAEALFAMEEYGLAEPINGQLAWAVARYNDRAPEVVVTYDAVKDELARELLEQEAERIVFENLDLVEEDVAQGVPLEQIAEKNGLKLFKVAKVDAAGNGPDGEAVAQLEGGEALLQEAFASTKGFESDPVEFAENAYVLVRVDEIFPSALKPLEEVKDDIVTAWTEAERKLRLRSMGDEFVARGNAGESLEAIADEVGRGTLTSPALTRSASDETFSAFVVNQIFNADEKTFVSGPVGMGESIILAQVTAVVKPSPEGRAAAVAAMRTQLSTMMASDTVDLYVSGLQGRWPVEHNQSAIDQVVGITPPS